MGEWRYSSTHSLSSALDGGEWSASHPGRFTPREGAPDTLWIGGWVDPRASLDTVSKETNSQPPPGFESRSSYRPGRSQSLYRLSYPGCISLHNKMRKFSFVSLYVFQVAQVFCNVSFSLEYFLLTLRHLVMPATCRA
jgi:hypothetical protein